MSSEGSALQFTLKRYQIWIDLALIGKNEALALERQREIMYRRAEKLQLETKKSSEGGVEAGKGDGVACG